MQNVYLLTVDIEDNAYVWCRRLNRRVYWCFSHKIQIKTTTNELKKDTLLIKTGLVCK